jgi:pimeloyl-ACP methyl ester carboxylesterase
MRSIDITETLQSVKTAVLKTARYVAVAAGLGHAGASIAADAEMQTIAVNGADIRYEISGDGEPLLLIHGTGVAATFALVMDEAALADYRIIRMHRRGFGGSSATPIPFSIRDHAADAAGLLKALGIEKAHVFGHSFGGSVALQLAVDTPDVVHSLVVSDAALFNGAPASFGPLMEAYAAGNKEDAMNRFSTLSYGADWRTLALKVDAEGPEQVMRDVDTVFQTEVQGMIDWGFGEEDAKRITQPMLFVTGSKGGNAALGSLQAWIENIIDVAVLPDLTHALLMQDPAGVANAVAPFLKRHPITD